MKVSTMDGSFSAIRWREAFVAVLDCELVVGWGDVGVDSGGRLNSSI